MARIQIGGAGGAPANNVIRALRHSERSDHLIGTSCVPSDRFLADVDEWHWIPAALDERYPTAALGLLGRTKPDLLHLQHDFEVRAIARIREQVEALGVRLYLPSTETIEACVDKHRSYEIWRAAGVRVPETMLIEDPTGLRQAFDSLGGAVWLRAIEGGGGRGALPTDSYEFARLWIERYGGWGQFTAAKVLKDSRSVTWQSIWYQGELVVAQSRLRRSWNFGSRAVSGVTGITGVAETIRDVEVDRIARDAIQAIDSRPHGIFGVDMTYDAEGVPNPTEINIGRFFTTIFFFARAGLNMPQIYCDIALDKRFPSLERTVNPLPPGLVWIRGMDVEPALTTRAELEALERSCS
jgi:hypothetical protein